MSENTAIEKELSDSYIHLDVRLIEHAFKSHYSKMYRYALKFVDHTTAEDLVQDIFTQLIHQNGLQCSNLKSYLFKAVHNKCLGLIKRVQVHQNYIQQKTIQLKIDELDFFNPETGEKSLIFDDDQIKIINAINNLPPKCAEIIRMKYLNELSNQEIADSLNISKKTVEVQVYKGLKQLKTHIKPICLCFFLI